MMRSLLVNRRTVLRGAVQGAAVAVGLPALESMQGRGARAAGASPKRFGKWFWGGGPNAPASFCVPTATGTGWTPPAMLAPLAAVKEYVTVVSGTEFKHTGVGHNVSRASALSNSYSSATPNLIPQYGGASLPSIDQVVATAWQGQTLLPSIEVRISRSGEGPHSGSCSFKGPKQIVRPVDEPGQLYDRMFAAGVPTGGGTPSTGSQLLAARQGVIDATLESGNALRARLGTADRARLDAHLDTLRQIEKKLVAKPAATGAACGGLPKPGVVPPKNGGEDLETRNQLMSDLIAVALSCDLTRVFSVEFSCNQSSTRYWQVGASDGHHAISHSGNPIMQKIAVFIMQQFAYLVQKLKSTPEGAGNLLDSVCLYNTTEYLSPGSHNLQSGDHPLLVVGRAGGTLRAGQHFRASGRMNAGEVMLAMLRAVGLNLAEYGMGAGLARRGVPEIAA